MASCRRCFIQISPCIIERISQKKPATCFRSRLNLYILTSPKIVVVGVVTFPQGPQGWEFDRLHHTAIQSTRHKAWNLLIGSLVDEPCKPSLFQPLFSDNLLKWKPGVLPMYATAGSSTKTWMEVGSARRADYRGEVCFGAVGLDFITLILSNYEVK